MRGKLDVREIEDIGDTALSAAEAKALASGNPLVLDKANADAAYQKLRRQETAHHRAQAALRHRAQTAREVTGANERSLDALRAAAARTVDVSGDAFRMQIEGRTYNSRQDAAEALGSWSVRHQVDWLRATETPLHVGSIGGHDVTVRSERITVDWKVEIRAVIALDGVPLSGSRATPDELNAPTIGLIRSIENKTTAIERNIADVERRIAAATSEVTEAEARLNKAFPHADALKAAQQRVQEVDAALEASNKPSAAESAEVAAERSGVRAASFPAPPQPAARGSEPVASRTAGAIVYERSDVER